MMDGLTKIKFWGGEAGPGLRFGALSGRRLAAALLVLAALAAIGVLAGPWRAGGGAGAPPGFVSGNGRIEAVEVDVATRLPGRLAAVLVEEGDTVVAGQLLARMDSLPLLAQRGEARARERQARDAVAQAEAGRAMRRSDEAALAATVVQRRSELDAAERRLRRSGALAAAGAVAAQELDDDTARVRGAEAALAAARAQREAAAAAGAAAAAQVVEARSNVAVAAAATARIDADLRDLALTAPRAGRVQYRVAEPGEVLAGGATVLNLIDLGDVFMSFFVPEAAAGRIPLGAEVRLQLDAAPGFIVPARVTYVASAAQFTPKSVETASEREKLMFRVKAQVDRAVLQRYAGYVKAGVPGVAWLRVDRDAPWPPALALRSGA
ncbi:efflux RND transporter periplasmic adaptor subunit [Massilia sp. G4R7]|uniref:Efflux RND transporter periplasmic adaptor subunit n=1 Tax=Massilia phyllostachyos TaxID=2898585 RepID=A0ABS8Q378_9BURK|nr:efflux RND transporter periplasmic adaptor subunit [Massilia phyllostachyos]MCD2516199.1 efflux RND transporter periplasmic adaptor subunit [Massilia phyllostachyos]